MDAPHEYGPSRIGHGEAQCKWCHGTNRENAIISPNHCEARAAAQPAAPSSKEQSLTLCLQAVMAELADLLDSDQFNRIEAIVLRAGVPYPPLGTDPRISNTESADSTEQYYAHMEADRNAAEAAYFNARPLLDREGEPVTTFRAGFERAYQLLWNDLQSSRRETDRACREYRELNHKYVLDMRRAGETTANELREIVREISTMDCFYSGATHEPDCKCIVGRAERATITSGSAVKTSARHMTGEERAAMERAFQASVTEVGDAGPLCPQCKTELAFEGDVCGLCFPVAQP